MTYENKMHHVDKGNTNTLLWVFLQPFRLKLAKLKNPFNSIVNSILQCVQFLEVCQQSLIGRALCTDNHFLPSSTFNITCTPNFCLVHPGTTSCFERFTLILFVTCGTIVVNAEMQRGQPKKWRDTGTWYGVGAILATHTLILKNILVLIKDKEMKRQR